MILPHQSGCRGCGHLSIFSASSLGFSALASRIQRGKFDVIYCNDLRAALVGGLMARIFAVPVLWHLHDTSLPKTLRPAFRWMARSANVRIIICANKASSVIVSIVPEKIVVAPNPAIFEQHNVTGTIPRLRRDEDGTSATLVSAIQPEALAKTALKHARNSELWNNEGKAGYGHISGTHDIVHYARRIEALIMGVCT